MPTVASSVTSEQAPVRPAYSLSIQSLYQASDVFAFAHRLAIEVLHEETAVKEAYDREPLKGRTYMSLRPWNVEQLDRPNSRYADQEHFYWYTEAGQTIPAGWVFTTSLSSTASTSASCGRRRLSLKRWRPQRTYLPNRTTKNYGPRLVDETAFATGFL
jgi:hypothetical protein